MSGRLTDGFREMIELRWEDFVQRENSLDATNFDAVVCTIIRSCMKSNLRAIQQALDRLDGKVAMEIEVEYPKFYTLYPLATKTADDPAIIDMVEPIITSGTVIRESTPKGDNPFPALVGSPADVEEQEAAEEELPTGSLRAVLEKMLDSPKSIVMDILAVAEAIDDGDTSHGNPMVKSVVVAGLMKLVHDGRISAVFEVFDQIDGKVADTIKVLGDTYMKNYSLIAPAGAIKNEDGIYMMIAENTTNSWVAKLEAKNKKKR